MNGAPTVPAKRLLTPTRGSEDEFYYTDYTLNLYHGCNHGCVYCDTRSVCYHMDDFDTVRVKANALSLLEDELRRKRMPGVVGMGAATDPYNALEARVEVTRGALKLLRRYGFGVGIPTKSALIARDADVLAEIGRSAPVRVCFSITTADESLARLIEPGAPSPGERFAAMRALADAGVFCGLWLNPMLPFLTDTEENVRALLRQTAEAGGRYAVCHFAVTLREGDREYFFQALDAHPRFAGVKRRYIDAFGLDYVCPSPEMERLVDVFDEECARLGLMWRFSEINRAMRAGLPTQTTLLG